MKIRSGINVGLWIGATAGIYSFIFALTPMGLAGLLPVTFISLPIFFSAGARKDDILSYTSSALVGVAWAAVYIFGLNWVGTSGIPSALATGLVIFIFTAALCIVHLIATPKGLFSSIPTMFGAIASTFLIGLDHWPFIALTLVLGVLLGYVNSLGFKLVDADGRWTLPRRSATA